MLSNLTNTRLILTLFLCQLMMYQSQIDFKVPKIGEKLILQSVERNSYRADPPGDEFTLQVTPIVSYHTAKIAISFCTGFSLNAKTTYHIEVKENKITILKKLENNEFSLDFTHSCIGYKSIVFVIGENTNLEIELLKSSFSSTRVNPKNPPKLKPIVHDNSYHLISSLNEINTFRREFLNKTNQQRQTHMVNNLTVDPLIEEYAQYYAEWLVKHRKCTTDRTGGSFSPKSLFNGEEEQMNKGKSLFGDEYWNWIINSYERFGENLYLEISKDKNSCTAEKMANIYYGDIKQYAEANPNYNTEYTSKGEGSRFSQAVWKGTKYIGVGYAKCYNEITKETVCYTISSYYPPGNSFKEYSSNVNLPNNLEEILDTLI